MRYSIEPKYRKYVKGYRVLSFARKFVDKYGKKVIDTATKTGIAAAKTASKRVIQKTAEAAADLIENKIVDKITSSGKTKSKKRKKKKDKKSTCHQKKESKLLITWNCFDTIWKMEYQKINNLLDTTPDEITRFTTKKWVEVHNQSGSDRYEPSKPVRFNTLMLRLDLCNFSDAYIVVKGDITSTKADGRDFIDIRDRFLALKDNATFTNSISRINNALIDNAEDQQDQQ